MKNTVRLLVVATAASVLGNLIAGAIRTKKEKLFRLAAGESDYDRTHPRGRKSR